MIKEEFKVSEDRPFYHGDFWPQGVPRQLDYDYSLTLGKVLDNAVKKWPDLNAMWFIKKWMTYGELGKHVDALATYLANIGVKKGDTVAMLLPNCFQYVIGYYAIGKIGAVSTGVNPTYKPLEILHQVKLTEARYLITLDSLYVEGVKPILDKWDFDKVIYTHVADMISPIIKFLGTYLAKKIPKAEKITEANTISLKDVLKTPPNVPDVDIDPEKDLATLIMTGGTTGVPKAAALSHQNVVSNAKQCEAMLLNQKPPEGGLSLGVKTGMVGVLPLFHSFAMTTVMNATLTVGGFMILFPRPPETTELLKDLSSLPIPNGLIYCAAEILFKRIADLPQETIDQFDLGGKLKLCISGAGPLHEYVRIPFEEKTGAKITEGYGLSEASPVVSANNFYGKREPGYIGVPAPGTDWMIFDREDFSKGPINKFGEEEGTGEICVCGPQVMTGYYKQPDRTAATIKEWDGRKWLLTGDIGFMDEHGRIQIRDRKKQLIKMAGHSVFPKEVEELLGSHEKIAEVAVAGLPDEKTGEAVKAWVALAPGAEGTITPQEIIDWAMENMTKWKVPKYIDIIDEVPKSIIGKVMRRTLQEADPLWLEVHGKKD